METHGRNTSSESLLKITNTTEVSLNNKTEVKGTVEGIDLKGTKTAGSNLATGKGTVTTEVMAGQGTCGFFVSQKDNSTVSQTDVGWKVASPQTMGFIFTFKMGVTVQKDEKK